MMVAKSNIISTQWSMGRKESCVKNFVRDCLGLMVMFPSLGTVGNTGLTGSSRGCLLNGARVLTPSPGRYYGDLAEGCSTFAMRLEVETLDQLLRLGSELQTCPTPVHDQTDYTGSICYSL